MSVANAYARGFRIVRELPLLFVLPVAAEFLQHTVEMHLGMYGGSLDSHAQAVRLGFGMVKILAVFLTLLVALRWWGLAGNLGRALRPSWRLAGGLALTFLVEMVGDLLAIGIGLGIIELAGDSSRGLRMAAILVPLMGWKFVAGLIYPWYVALLIEDREMRLRRSIAVMRGRVFHTFGLLVAGYLPLMIVHYALGLGAMGRSGPLLWVMMIVDAGVVALLVAMLAATYFEIFTDAKRV
jgi:hypothetical protein